MNDYWQDKRCLVLGGCGFVGQHLVKLLLDAGAKVRVLDNLTRGKLENLPVGAEFIFGDCSNEGNCRDVFKDQQHVFNLAAWVAGVQYNQNHQAEMYYRNWLAQMTPLRIAHEYGIDKYLCVSSVCVYAPGYNAPCLEANGFRGEPVPANLGYSLAKRAGERMSIWYADAGLHTVRVRPSNIYGPNDYFDERAHVIPALIKKAFEDKEIVANGSGMERREFLYVTDAAQGMMNALRFGTMGGVYNLGTNGSTAVSISALTRLIRIEADVPDKLIYFRHRFDTGDSSRWSNAKLANAELHWHHEVDISEGIRRTVKWYREKQNDCD